ncbi:hypothetical protein TruAng_005347 [Truncatella angustata]|nr:hypothetical protein TruAng_005347 [Truncatella angustata]
MDSLGLGGTAPRMLSFNGTSPDFDYMAFLQDDGFDYLAEESSSNSASAPAAGPSSDISPSNDRGLSKKGLSQRQRLERRGHTKSRLGCYNCKRRRIKCQETHPACGHCVKSGLQCEYPNAPTVIHQPQQQVPLFSLQDMRFFQHFLQVCYPHHPLGNESIWTHEVPCLSQNHEHLMHAILGLSASELMVNEPNLATFAMTHRLKAIKAIKKQLTDGLKTDPAAEGNALVATCFALTFQSVLLDDGMAEYMTFIRGILITAIQMWCKGAKFMFHNFIGEDQMAILKPLMEQVPITNKGWTDMAVAGMKALRPLCKHEVEIAYHGMIQEIAETLYTSPFKAYELLTRHYGWWMQISHQNFAHLIDPNNTVCTLLASHWIALKQIMASITEKEYEARQKEPNKEKTMELGIGRWLKYLNRQVPPEFSQYNWWPTWVEAQLDEDAGFFGKRAH